MEADRRHREKRAQYGFDLDKSELLGMIQEKRVSKMQVHLLLPLRPTGLSSLSPIVHMLLYYIRLQFHARAAAIAV